MNLTEAERVKLGIRTIGAVDVTPKQRKEARSAVTVPGRLGLAVLPKSKPETRYRPSQNPHKTVGNRRCKPCDVRFNDSARQVVPL